jgi:hypothetical protein
VAGIGAGGPAGENMNNQWLFQENMYKKIRVLNNPAPQPGGEKRRSPHQEVPGPT